VGRDKRGDWMSENEFIMPCFSKKNGTDEVVTFGYPVKMSLALVV
jgi:hypothetical protein